MRVNGLGTKRRIATAAGVMAVVLAGASFAWACTTGSETALVATGKAPLSENTTATAGDVITVEGSGWQPEGTVSIYLSTSTGDRPLADNVPIVGARNSTAGSPGQGGTISAQMTVPSGLAPGTYPMMIRHSNGDLSRVAQPKIIIEPAVVRNNPAPTPTNGTPNNNAAVVSPVPVDVPAAVTESAPSPVAPGETAQAPEAVAAQPALNADPVFTAEAPSSVVPADEWAASPSSADRARPRSLTDPSSGTNGGGLLVGAGLLAVGSVALFGGFAVAVARRRKVGALASPGF